MFLPFPTWAHRRGKVCDALHCSRRPRSQYARARRVGADEGWMVGFLTPMYELGEYLAWTRSGEIQLPDFQRGYKWEDERIRQLLVTVLRGHPLGAVMLLKTGNAQVRFKPRAIEGVELDPSTEAKFLLLDGQQRLTSLTQALSGDGKVSTKDARGKLLDRRYLIHMATALDDENRVDEALISVPADGVVRTNFGKDIVLDLSDSDKRLFGFQRGVMVASRSQLGRPA